MKNIILAWLNANATNEVKANEIEYHCNKLCVEFAQWFNDFHSGQEYEYSQGYINQLLETYKNRMK
jgi:hypothetical protein